MVIKISISMTLMKILIKQHILWIAPGRIICLDILYSGFYQILIFIRPVCKEYLKLQQCKTFSIEATVRIKRYCTELNNTNQT